jgi:O-acetyl-ADP-ribose deacetylase (regulator of RNase III)
VNEIHYVTGDATRPVGDGPKIIAHICNDIGAWGAGFTNAINRRWIKPQAAYRLWSRRYEAVKSADDVTVSGDFALGEIQLIDVGDDIIIANMVAQHNVGSANGSAIRYWALTECLRQLSYYASWPKKSSIHMPRIGCGLAGGIWEEVEYIINGTLIGDGGNLEVYVYDLPVRA